MDRAGTDHSALSIETLNPQHNAKAFLMQGSCTAVTMSPVTTARN